MSKLFQFYMTLQDEQELLAKLLISGAVVYATYFPANALVEVDVRKFLQSQDSEEFSVLAITNLSIVPRLVLYSAGKERQAIDTTNSEVISWTRWQIKSSDGKKDPGSLWYDQSTDRCKSKRKEFLLWANSTMQIAKKGYHRSSNPCHFGRYFGPDAWQQLEAGNLHVADY